MSKSKEFDEYLVDYQPDLIKIISAYRRNGHKQTVDEILSQVNLYLIKTKDYILEKLGNDFSRKNFSKMAYTYARNQVSWQQSRILNSKYVKNRADNLHETEDGPKTTFELVTEYQGEEDEGFEAFDSSERFKEILKNIREYSSILTKTQLLYMRFLEVGFNYRQIASHFNVTHQAVSHEMRDSFEKISRAFKIDLNSGEDTELIAKGKEAMENFFEVKRGRDFDERDETTLITFLMDNPKKYKAKEICQKLFNGKYNSQSIGSICKALKLTHLLKKPAYYYSKKETSEFIKLINRGASYETVAKRLNKSVRSVCSKFGYLKSAGLIERYRYESKYDKQRKLAYELIHKGLSSDEIKERTGLSKKVIAGFRIALIRNKNK